MQVTSVDRTGKTRIRRRAPARVQFDKGSEMQRRARGALPRHLPPGRPPAGPCERHRGTAARPGRRRPEAAVDHAAATVAFTTDPHPSRPEGRRISRGDQFLTKVITADGSGPGEITMAQVAAYLAKYATKSTEITGHTSGRLTADTIGLFADRHGRHTERLVDACWRLGRARWTCCITASPGP